MDILLPARGRRRLRFGVGPGGFALADGVAQFLLILL
jgi:hypothetical protein